MLENKWDHGYYIIHEQCLHEKVILGVIPESGRWNLNGFFGV